jgi:hypothetical protein
MIKAPWTSEQVKALKWYQNCTSVHPHTCICKGSPILSVSKNGFFCRKCGHTQKWCSEAVFEMVKYKKSTHEKLQWIQNIRRRFRK